MPAVPPRAVLYVRLSVSDDASTSVVRQEADLREHAQRECWDVVRVLVDDGISGRKARANAAEALRMLRDSEADVLAVWKFDRWSRQGLGAVADLIAALDSREDASFVALRDGLRSDQPAWRIIASVLAEVARMEAENTSTRTRASIAGLRKMGRFSGGTVPFGYMTAPAPDGPGRILVPVPEEAVLLGEIATRIVDGQTVTSVVNDLNARGVPTTRSAARAARLEGKPTDGLATGRWSTSSLQTVITSEHLLGRRKVAGRAVLGDDGLPERAWEPVLDLATLTLIRARVRAPKSDTPARPQRVRAARLLSGLAYCAHCGGKMYVNTSGPTPVYTCPKREDPSCPAPRMTATIVERHVSDRFLAIDGDKPERVLVEVVGTPETDGALEEIEEAVRATSVALAQDDADLETLLPRLAMLKERRAALRTIQAPVEQRWERTGRTRREAWDAEERVDKRRELLLEALDHVTIAKLPAGKARKGFHPERIGLVWRVDAEDELRRADL